MSLTPGVRVGPYEVLSSIGAGGMGEVCRARDTKLNREVALKVLPDAFAADPDRMSRFQREAQLLAALNHPNIAAIYGLEDAGPQPAIVMELVEGRTLAGPLPVADALPLAKQIAEAIEYAHDRGIIHRDLKPANIKVSPDGTVKVLDFGLAKAMDDSTDPVMNVLATMSPTLSLAATHAGVILGTAAYMAPEQAKGKPADRRSDIWAFGIVLYEMLTGAPVFGGDSVPETLASVMKDPIAFSKLPAETPQPIRRLVTRCLEREPRRRLQSIGEARIILEDVIAGVPNEEGPPAAAPAALSKWLWALTAVAVLTAVTALGWIWSRPTPVAPRVTRFRLPPPDGTTFTSFRAAASNLAVSPNGQYLAFIVDQPNQVRTLWVRALDSLFAQHLDRTEGATYPFWSPDSQHIAYFANGKLMRVPVAGGAPLTISSAPDGEGGTWSQDEGQDGVIVFAPGQTGPLQRVVATGGVPAPVTKLAQGETAHSFPQFLSDGRRILYLAEGSKSGLYVQSLDADDRRLVVNSTGRAAFSPPGLLLFVRENTLFAQRWNLDALQLEGEPAVIAEDVRSGGTNGRNAFAVSATGVLAYRHGGFNEMQINWYARDGKPAGKVLEAGEYGSIELSPDDSRLVLVRGIGEDRDLWLKDLAGGGVFSRLTSAAGPEGSAVWFPDSSRVAYVGRNDGADTLFQTVIGSGKHTVLPTTDKQTMFPQDVTPDGKQLVLRYVDGRTPIGLLPLLPEGPSRTGVTNPQKIFEESYNVDQLRVSPDGKWVAYVSLESGQTEVSVASFPAFTDRRQISTAGGTQPVWRSDAKELFFLGLDARLMAVDVTSGTTLQTGTVRTLFQTSLISGTGAKAYAVTRDGQRFLLREPSGRESGSIEQLYIVTNWTSLVRQ
jgi:Tol biopolymer transport system component